MGASPIWSAAAAAAAFVYHRQRANIQKLQLRLQHSKTLPCSTCSWRSLRPGRICPFAATSITHTHRNFLQDAEHVQMHRSSMQAVFDRIDTNLPAVRRTLEELIRIPSVSADPARATSVRDSADAFAQLLRDAGASNVAVLTVPNAHSIVCGDFLASADARTLLVYGHHDVQPPGRADRWLSPPFDPPTRCRTPPVSSSAWRIRRAMLTRKMRVSISPTGAVRCGRRRTCSRNYR